MLPEVVAKLVVGEAERRGGAALVELARRQRAFSDQTLEPTTEWLEVGPAGQIEAFTIVYEAFRGLPDPPYAFGYVMLDGADTAIGGLFKGIDLKDPAAAAKRLSVGTRVTTKFVGKRKGEVLDFWFEVTPT